MSLCRHVVSSFVCLCALYVVVALFSLLYAVVVYYMDWLQSFLYKPAGWTETKSTVLLYYGTGQAYLVSARLSFVHSVGCSFSLSALVSVCPLN